MKLNLCLLKSPCLTFSEYFKIYKSTKKKKEFKNVFFFDNKGMYYQTGRIAHEVCTSESTQTQI